jgi:hypothetical protein
MPESYADTVGTSEFNMLPSSLVQIIGMQSDVISTETSCQVCKLISTQFYRGNLYYQ